MVRVCNVLNENGKRDGKRGQYFIFDISSVAQAYT
jgi:hypothetical protein